MADLLLLLVAGAFTFIGGSQIALSQSQYSRRVKDEAFAMRSSTLLRWCGVALLCLGFGICIARNGFSFGFILWLLLLVSAFFAIVLVLSFYPKTLKWLLAEWRQSISR